MPRAAGDRAQQLMQQQWSQDLIRSWNEHDWIDLPLVTGEKIAALVGASAGQVICCDSTSVNLFKLLCSALGIQKGRRIVLSQADNFPTDLYMVQGLNQLMGDEGCLLEVVEEGQITSRLNESVAVLLLTHVNYRSGRLHDIQRITELAHQQGVLVIWDLSHSTGVLPLELDEWGVDFAVGCGYKYLNGGPGAPAFLYVAKRHQDAVQQPLSGWMGHATPFSFSQEYQAAQGIERYLCGTPPVLSMSIMDAALSVFAGVNMADLRAKSIALGELFAQLVADNEELNDLTLVSPQNGKHRGSQLAYRHPDAYSICQVLIERGVIADFRAPDVLRFGFAPLYIRFQDAWDAVSVLASVMVEETYRLDQYRRVYKVT